MMLFLNKPFFMSQFTPEDIVNIWTQGAHQPETGMAA